MGDSDSRSSCGCGGCLGVIVLGTAIVGTVMLGGCSKAWHKVQSTWAYDSKMQSIQRVFDANKDGVLDKEEKKKMYRSLEIPTVEGEIPSVKIPYENMLNFEKRYGQEL